jgi:hypothetical protein
MVVGTPSGAETGQCLIEFFALEKKDIPSRTLWLSPTQGGSPTSSGTFPFDGLGRHLGAVDVTLSM